MEDRRHLRRRRHGGGLYRRSNRRTPPRPASPCRLRGRDGCHRGRDDSWSQAVDNGSPARRASVVPHRPRWPDRRFGDRPGRGRRRFSGGSGARIARWAVDAERGRHESPRDCHEIVRRFLRLRADVWRRLRCFGEQRNDHALGWVQHVADHFDGDRIGCHRRSHRQPFGRED